MSCGQVGSILGETPSASPNSGVSWPLEVSLDRLEFQGIDFPDSKRRGYRIRWLGKNRVAGYGECMVLPGYSTSTAADVEDVLSHWPALARSEFALALDRVGFGLPAVEQLRRVPEAWFGVETALLDWVGRSINVPIWKLLGGGSSSSGAGPLANSMLVLNDGASFSSIVANVKQALAEGISTFKFKVSGGQGFDASMKTLLALRERLGSTFQLRIDANQSLEPAELRRLVALSPQYVEEGLPFERWPEYRGIPLRFAVDESLLGERGPARERTLLASDFCSVVIVKPAARGFSDALALARRSLAAGFTPVVTHMMDGPIARAAAASLALVIGEKNMAVGLGEHQGLSDWPSVHTPWIKRDRIETHREPGLGVGPGAQGWP